MVTTACSVWLMSTDVKKKSLTLFSFFKTEQRRIESRHRLQVTIRTTEHFERKQTKKEYKKEIELGTSCCRLLFSAKVRAHTM